MKNDYRDKYFSVLGDSISTFKGCSEPENAAYYDEARKKKSGINEPSQTWWGRVIAALGGKLLVNNSFSGSTVCNHLLYEIPSYSCSDERTSALDKNGFKPDVIMVYMGTNDWAGGVQVEYDEDPDGPEEETKIFSSAYKIMLEKLKKNYPQAEIFCFTLPINRCPSEENFEFPYRLRGRHIVEYCAAIKECAKECGCRVVDLFESAEPDTMDGFHPTADGMETIATAVLKELG